ncbi:LysR family transcriptional regulator [Clostridium sp. chh4-2]|uniref:LysR family transcriptional regulator n=1 Tax=Clostridium sp. chh4-2 TaxID=2067550 RepID=UPI000CCE384C|nr:LysR family transcriptional regulator [Clostridium sp. chh4-2]PNV61219.1 LysR family transcriptional regulator [Clostridium sp. chh4-2]
MDFTSLYYFSELTKDMHFTRTAERLFMSQQTLSNHIMRLEEHYGVRLLHRKPTLTLTYAGEQVLAFANHILREEANLKDILADVEQQKRGIIRFGASSMRMNSCLPGILPDFSSRYPLVEIHITDANSAQLEQKILKGELDLAITISPEGNPKLADIPLMTDQVYLCVSDTLLQQYYPARFKELKQKSRFHADVKDFSNLPFCMLDNRMGKSIEKCFHAAGFTPKIYTTSSYIQIGTALGLKGLAACFATRTSLLNMRGTAPDDINIFPLYMENEPVFQQISMIYHVDRYQSAYILYFLKLAEEYYHKMGGIPINELVKG